MIESLCCFLSSCDSIRVLYLVEFLIFVFWYLYVGIRKLGEINDWVGLLLNWGYDWGRGVRVEILVGMRIIE